MSAARPWLPEACLTAGRTVAAVSAIVDDWAAHWFANPPLIVGAAWTRRGRPVPDAGDWAAPRPVASGLTLQLRTGASEAIAEALLTLPGQRVGLSASDRLLLETVTGAIWTDLEVRLGRLAPGYAAAGAADETPPFELAISDAMGRPLLRLSAQEALLVGLVKRASAAPKVLPPLAGRDAAIADAPIECAARIGRARLAYADLCGLAVGDVLILDSGREASFDLMVDGTAAASRMVVATGPDLVHASHLSLQSQGLPSQ